MASKLKVDELRSELSKRGLSIAGVKPTLVKRLESAIRKENNQSTSTDGRDSAVVGKKREREPEDEDYSNANMSDGIEKFEAMSYHQLRKEASRRGVPSNGTKKELVERLSAHLSDGKVVPVNGHDKQEEEEEEEKEESMVEEVKTEKLVTATKKGSAVLDPRLPDHIKTHYHVLEMGDEIYDAMLNQTNVGHNNNKFYMIQALEADGGGTFMVYNRWGRVGVKGQDKLFGPYSCRFTATQEFEQKFFAKTKNHWSDRKDFVSYPNCYTWLEMDYGGNEQSDQGKPSASCIDVQPQESKLERRIAKFISLICNIGMMRQQMMEIGYNAEKLPLGKLSKSTILKGYGVLKRIADVMGQSDKKLLEQLSGEFYTVIPHDFGFKKMREFIIDTPKKLKNKLEMVEALGEIELATKLLGNGAMEEDPLYAQYERLHCGLAPVEAGSEEFFMIEKYTKNTHAKTHSNYTVDIIQIFKVSREGETDRFKKFAGAKNRMLLWHGSRLTNWAGILSQGLRIAPPEAPSTGYMFGKGVYFADMFSKSANYCCSSSSAPSGVLLLCEVALGEMEELHNANYDADKLPSGKLSTKGVGSTAPDLSESQVLKDGVIVPYGQPKQTKSYTGGLLYNEYIVYNVDQVRMRYVIQVSFNYTRKVL